MTYLHLLILAFFFVSPSTYAEKTRAPFTSAINSGNASTTPDTLSFETDGVEQMYIDSSGDVTITGLANLGVIHTNTNGTLSTSPVVNADIADGTIGNEKMADIGSTNTPDTIVVRNGSGNFSAGTISADLVGNVTGNVSGSSATFTNPLTGDVTGIQGSTVVSFVGGVPAATIANSTSLVNTATSSNIPNTIVERDGFGDFSANTITANLLGNATSATTSTNSTNFTGSLIGDVTGTQNATVVSLVGGQTAADVASATTLANAATSADTANSIVKRDSSGNFSAGTVSADVIGNVTGNVSGSAASFTDSLLGDVTGTQSATVVSSVGGQSAANIATSTSLVGTATSNNISNTLVKRDASGNFSANTITANVTGNVSGSAANFTGSLVGDVTGTQSATIVSSVGGQSATNIATATVLANNATSADTANSIVKRDGSGSFTANTVAANLVGNVTGNVSGSAASFTDSLSGDVTGTQNATVVSFVGGTTASDVATATATVDAATSTNTPNTLVIRDASGNFSADTITANIIGNVTGNVSGSTTNFTGSLSGDVTGTQGATVVSTVGGATASDVAAATATVDAATNLNTPSTLVERDASGNFTAGIITAGLTGNVTGNVSGTSSSFTSSLAGDVTGTQNATTVNFVGGQTATNVAAATSLVGTATSNNLPSTLVERDASGNFSAGTITADLIGNVTGSTTNFTGSLTGDVTGTQSATVVSSVGGQSAANIATATSLVNTATSNNIPSTLVERDASGNFAANTITANLLGNATSATTANNSTNFTGSLTGDVTGTQSATIVSLVGGQSAADVANATTLANAATNADTANAIVKRDASGNFSAGTVSADVIGNVTGNVSGSAASFTGSLLGDVTGTQSATVVSSVGGQSAANIAASTSFVGTATSNNIQSTLVERDASGNFSANTITANITGNVSGSAASFTGPLSGDVTGTQAGTIVSSVGGQSAANIAAATSLVGTATSNNIPSTLVERDALGNFAANTITANITGNVSGSAASFTGPLSGDVTGTQAATIVSSVGGQSATNIASATSLVGTATSNNIPNTLVERDASGNFAAGIITANVIGNVTGNVTGSAASFTGSLLGDVTGTQGATVVSTVGGATASDIATATATVDAATNLNTPNTLVERDASGNFAAGIITAGLTGNVTGNVSGSAASFTGSLLGDVTGTQSVTTVSSVGGQSAASIAAATSLVGTATSNNIPSTLVERDALGNFAANTITANITGNVSGSAASFTGPLSGDVTGTQAATIVSSVGGQSATNIASATSLVGTATSNNIPSTLVERDASGNFAANTITANLLGNATSATTANNSTNFTGSLAGDVTGTQTATVVSLVGGQSAADVANATTLANAATSADTASAIVKRDASGNFAAGIITAGLTGNVTGNVSGSAASFTGSLLGDVTGIQGATVVSSVGGQSATNIAASTSLVATATSNNIPSTLVARDASGNFAANTITANITGNVSGSAASFTGPLSGDVTGTQSATVVNSIGGQSAANIASATSLVGTATSNNIPSTLVERDASGNFAASTITANVIGNVTGNVTGSAASFTGSLLGDVTGTQSATVVSSVGGQSAANIAAATSLVGTATSNNVPSTIVERNASGDFSAGIITASLTGNVTGNVSGSAASFTGSLLGDVTGTQGATVVSTVGGATATNIAAATSLVDTATSNNIPNTLVERDGSGNFAANIITANLIGNVTGDVTGNVSGSAANFTGSLLGDVTGTQSATVVSLVGGATASDVAAATATVDAATNLNTPSTLVERDTSGNFSAGTITANLIGNVTGSASLNVLKAGDSMTGALNLLAQNEVRFQDTTSGNYVGINAQSTVPTSYTLSLPTIAPTAHQFLQSNGTTPTNLEWVTTGGSVTPTNSKIIYVAKYGNDITGDGSFNTPYATLSKAITTANSLASLTNPIAIFINPGIYVENNSSGPLTIAAEGISIIGYSSNSVNIIPSTLSNDLLLTTQPTQISNVAFVANGVSTATGISLTAGSFSTFNDIQIYNFNVGATCSGTLNTYTFNNCTFIGNTTALIINNGATECNSCAMIGSISLSSPENIGINITGSQAVCFVNGGTYALLQTAALIQNNARIVANAVNFESNNFDIIQTSASKSNISSCSFVTTFTDTDIKIQVSDAGTLANIIGCQFDGKDPLGITRGTCIEISDNAEANVTSASIANYVTALHIGLPADTNSTILGASNITINDCSTDILQEGSSALNFNASTASSTKISINDPTNVNLAFFDLNFDNALEIGPTADVDINLLQAAISTISNPGLDYRSSLYATQAIGFHNPTGSSSTLFALSDNNTNVTSITTDRTKTASLNLFSDEGSPIGGTSALRGWDIIKTGTSATLSFNYQNSDVFGQSVIPQYTVIQLDGVNNQLQLPTAATQIVFGGDTNLYRSAANVLKTDGNFIVGTLTANRAVITNASNQLASSVTSDTEISYLSGTTSAIQTQLNSKVAKAGDTMTGTLQLPAGSTSSPSLTFTGSTTTGLSAASDNLSFSTGGSERMKVSSSGTISINGFNTTGVVHNDSFGNLSTSLIVNTDISPTAAITDSKLANITTAGKVANSATTATSLISPNSIVAQDSSGNFAANIITASLLGNVTGSASNNVLKAGDNMTGALNMLTQNEVRFQDAAGGEYVGINAPNAITASYTLSLPSVAPLANQVLRANSTTPTNLEWISLSGNNPPAISKTIYITKYGNDITGTGSFLNPYASLSKAITTANSIASGSNPITILISAGIYVENNSTGPLTVSADGISIVGDSSSSVFIMPNTPTNDLILSNNTIRISNITCQSSSPLATGISLTIGNFSNLTNVRLFNFQTGIICAGSTSTYLLDNCLFIINGTALNVNDTTLQCNNCTISGAISLAGPAANTGVSATGSNTTFVMSGGSCVFCDTGITINNNARNTLNAVGFKRNTFDIIQTGASSMTLSGCSFERTNGPSDVDVQINGAGTTAEIIGCEFSGTSTFGTSQAAGILISDNASVNISSGVMQNYSAGIQIGTSSDSASTEVSMSSFTIRDCGTDIIQEGSTTLTINGCTASGSKININDPTNVNLAYFDLENNNELTIGSTSDMNTNLLQAAISSSNNPGIDYLSSLYSTQAIGQHNPTTNPSSFFTLGNDATNFTAITTNRTKTASINLFSDEGSPVGGTSALRGWDIIKTGTTASLTFNYQNSDTIGQSAIPQYTVMQLDGVNNQLQLPTAATQLVFANDTNLYRSAANVLKTDDNFIVGTLTANRAVITNASNQLASSITTDTEISYLSGTTSAIQTQLNSKVAKAGDTMTGTLQLPAGSTSSPSLAFTGSTTTGLSAASDNLSFSTGGSERMKVSSSGTISINGFNTTGVVHNDSFGNLSTSLIVNGDISPIAAITDSKLANITTAGKVANSATTATNTNTASTIVARDASGNFSAGTITANLVGNVTGSASNNVLKAGDTMTGALTVPAGTAGSPSLKFSGSTNTGISAATTNILSFDTNGTERMNINATGGVTINGLNNTGVVHTDNTGLLSTSLIVDADITNATISNSKLATISSSNTSGAIVVRDGSGNFSTNKISIIGAITNATDAATKSYVDNAISTGLVAKTPAMVVSISNLTLSGTQTVDGVALVANDRILLVGQTNPVDNGLWEVQTSAWTRPADFANGSTASQAYVLILSGNTYTGSSWLCNTPTAIVGTDPIMFAEFSLPDQTTGNNVGTGAGQVFRNKTSTILNFRTLAAGTHTTVTNNADDITFATDATDANTASTIVARDASGNFSATTITANVIGSASNNVLKTGDSMTGTLNMLTQNEVRFQDAAGGQYVGLNAPTTVPTSYTLALPTDAPTIGQTLRAGAVTANELEWVTEGGAITPTVARIIYVTSYGNDTTGDGSFDLPFASLAKAIDAANGISSAAAPVTIYIGAGTYTEDNSTSPLSVNVEGVSIVGDSPYSVIFIPNTPTNDFLVVNQTICIDNATFMSFAPMATGISLTNGNFSVISNVRVINFATGILFEGTTSSYLCESCILVNNTTGLAINDTVVEVNICTLLGTASLYGAAANTGLSIVGPTSVCAMTGGSVALCSTGLDVGNNSLLTASAAIFKLNEFDVIQTGASHMTLSACTFAITTTSADIDIQISGAGTYAEIIGCQFNGKDVSSISGATALHISDGALLDLYSGGMKNYTTAIHVGTPSDTSATQLNVSAFNIHDCTTDILQEGSATLNLNGCTLSSSKISINDPTNVKLAYFDLDFNNALKVGPTSDIDINLLQAAISTTNNPGLDYRSSLYSTQAIGFHNPTTNPSTLFTQSNNNTNVTAITTDRTKTTSINLFSDEGITVGGTSALRGWDIIKTGTTASLTFNYQNSDTIGQSAIPQYTVMQLDGVNNQLQLPTAATQIVFGGDTNLYRSAANVLKTDDNFIVGTLTANRAVITNASNQLASSVTTDTEISYLSGTTSAIQTQLNSKVAKTGDTMTGTLQLPAGSTSTPSLAFTGSTTTGLSASSNNLSFSTNGAESMKISSSGTVSINGFTTAGVVHNDTSGNLSTSLVTNADIIANAGIVDTKLANITTAGKVANSATTATSNNTANTIVARDASGNFTASIITANLTGSASNNVLKAGDSMTGTLNMLTQNEVHFQDAAGGQYVGLNAPTTIPSSYTLSLPSDAPTTNQTLRSGNITANELLWVTEGGAITPAESRVIYITQYGDDISGDGSFDTPYASLSKALELANTISSASTPVTIAISAGTYIEDNSAGALSVNVEGISIVGDSPSAVILMPNTPTNDFLLVNQTIYISNATFMSLAPMATGISLTDGQFSILNNLKIIGFATGIECEGTASSYLCESCNFINNSIGLFINNTVVEVNVCTLIGSDSLYNSAANTGLSIIGSTSVCAITGGAISLCETGLNVGNNALLTASAVSFKLNTFDVIQTAASHMTLSACTFAITTTSSDIDIQISGAGTYAEIIGCQFNGKDVVSIPGATALHISDGALLDINGGGMKNYSTAIHIGTPSDTSATQLNVSAFNIHDCTTDILQEGSTTLNLNGCTLSSSKISINDPTNIKLAYFDLTNNNSLMIGGTSDVDIDLIQAAIGTPNSPRLEYISSLYATQAIGYYNPLNNPSTLFALSSNATNITATTTDRTKATSINLFSDEGSPVGGTSALRGWDIIKTGTTATLSFNYQNSDTIGQSAIPQYTVMQLDGVNNQLQLPTAATQLVFANDTNLYRSAANVLKTDDNFIVGTLTPNRAIITNASNQLASSVTTDTEISYLSGTTSAIQTQLNSKVAKAGDTMTGTLQLPAGSTSTPSLAFTGSTTTGLSANSNNLSFSTNGTESMKISSGGTVSINGFTTAGVVHNDASGNLSSSLVTNADIIANAGIVDTKLATISTAGKVANSATTATNANTASTIVSRDSSGNFSAGTITANLNGNATTATTATSFSGSLAGDVTGTQNATVVSLVGGQTAASVAAATTLVSTATSNNIANTIVQRDASGNFSAGTITANLTGNVTGNVTGSASLNVLKAGDTMTGALQLPAGTTAAPSLVFTGNTTTGLSSNATNVLSFSTNALERMKISATGVVSVNAFTTAGLVHNDASGNLSSSLLVNADITPATITNASLATISSANTAGNIVVRDGSGNFAAGTITANLTGNATTATNATNFSGSLVGDVTGTQGATVVSSVGGQSAANVASATVLANAATNANTANAIVKRDASGNFSAGTITANLTGSASNNVLKAGDTMTGTLTHPAGTAANPSIQFTGSTNTGLSAATANTLSFDTNGTERMNINPTGGVTINGLNNAGVVHTSAAGLLSTSLIVNADITPATITNASLATISSTNTAGNIVVRDGSGNFAAGTITANLTGNATTATTATNFSGSLAGDVTGTQSATVVSSVGGQSAATVAATTSLVSTATSNNVANTIVKRDASGNFSAGTISANLTGNVTGNVTGSASNNVLKAGDTMTGTLTHPAGTAANPSIQFAGSTNTGLSAATANTLSFDTNGAERMKISSTGVVSVNAFTTAGLVHNDASGNLSSSLLVNADITPATITNASLATISSTNTAGNIVVRDGSGNFAAGTITANLTGNATTATTATNFSGSLVGDVTGTQGATVVSTVGGQTAANVAAATVLANAATSANTANAIVKRDASGNFSAGTITASLTGSASNNVLKAGDTMTGTLTHPAGTAANPSIQFTGSTNTGLSAATANTLSFDTNGTERMNINPTGGVTINGLNSAGVVHTSAAGLLSTSLIVNADITPATITNASLATISSANTAGNIVVRDGSGNFAAGTITANLTGNATTATTATNFSGSLAGDVTGTQGATVVSSVGGQSAANVAATTSLVSTATSNNVANTIVKRDASGNFSAGTITANLTGNVTGNVTGSASNNVLKAGDTMTGTLTHPAGTAANPSIQFTGSTNTGLSAATANTLSFDTNGTERMNINSTGGVTINGLNNAGVVHTSAAGLLSTSLIVNADITPATITNASLATISSTNTAGNIVVRDGSGNFAAGTITANLTGNATTATTATNFSGSLAGDVTGTQSATVVSSVGGQSAATIAATTSLVSTATSNNVANTIVKRDASGNFSAGTITANLTGNVTGNVTGSASNNVLKAGDTMTGTLTHPAGTAANPSIQFTGSTNTGLSAATANTLSFDTNGAERMKISSTGVVSVNAFTTAGLVHNDASGNLSSSLLVNADITPATITNASLATISSTNTAGNIVVRDGSGNFAAGTITANLSGNASTATSATNFSGSLVGDVTGTQGATVVSTVGGQTAANVAAATILANAATNTNTANAIVKRDASGNFSAGTISANLTGNVTGNVTGSASNNVLKAGDTMTGTLTHPAGTAANPSIQFTGSTNTGLSAASVNTLSFDTNGTERMNINPTGGVTINGLNSAGVVHTSAAGLLSTSLIVNADITPATITNASLATISSTNTAGNIVVRDGSGNFAAGTITANLTGNATTATTATNFSGSLAGDVTGTQGATVVSSVGGQSAATVAATTSLVSTATSNNVANTIVKRDASGNFSAGTITANLTGNVTGNVTGSASNNVLKAGDTMTGTLTHPAGTAANPSIQFTGSTNTGLSAATANTLSFDTNGAERMKISSTGVVTINGLNSAGVVHTSAAGLLSTSLIVDADITPATISNASLATISSANTAGNIVVRDGSGNFSAGTITANLTGNATTATTATNFSGSLAGDVTGTQGATVVSSVGGQSAATIAATTSLVSSATSNNVANTIVKRDASGNFSAGTITANLIGNVTGNVTGSASLNVLKAGDTMTGALQLPAGTTAAPSLIFTGNTTTGLSSSASNVLSFSTNALERMKISSSGVVSVNTFTSAGLVHNDASGNLSTSLLVNADITPATITNASLATISSTNTAGNIVVRDGTGNFSAGTITAALNGNATTATTATNFSGSLVGDVTGTQGATVVGSVGGQSAANVAAATVLANAATNANTANAIVRRDASGNFSAGTITANLIGNVTGTLTGSASLNVLKAGDTMTGTLTIPAGTAAAPSIQFTGSTNTGISAATSNKLSFDANGTESMTIDSSTITAIAKLVATNVYCNQAIQSVSITGNNQSVTAAANTSILILKPTGNRTNFTISFPLNPTNGQYFTILLGGTNTVSVVNNGNGATVVNGITSFSSTVGQSAVTYFYYATDDTWYRERTA